MIISELSSWEQTSSLLPNSGTFDILSPCYHSYQGCYEVMSAGVLLCFQHCFTLVLSDLWLLQSSSLPVLSLVRRECYILMPHFI